MKSVAAIWLCLLLWFPYCLNATPDSLGQRIGVIGNIPIMIASDHSVFDWQADTVFEISPGRLQLSLLPRGRAFNFDHLLQKKNQKPFPIERARKMRVLYCFGKQDKKIWLPILVFEKDSMQVLLDIKLKKDDVLNIAWREAGNDSIHAYMSFIVVQRTPEIIGYRLNNFYDTSRKPDRLEMKVLHAYNDRTGYQDLPANSLRIPPGSIPEFRIKTYKYLTDEVVKYCLTYDADTMCKWKQTGHVLVLSNLSGDKKYQLELKFPGQQLSSKYILIVGLHWYEKTWVRLTALILLIAATILITAWFYRRKLLKEKDNRTRVEEQLRTLQSRLNPHFIFNALSSIEGLVSSGQNKEANHYLSMFSDILRQTLEHSGELSISLSEDLSLLDLYLRIEQLRFGFQYSISVDQSIEASTLEVPPMLMQPLVENAVKHGVSDIGINGKIDVFIKADQSDMFVIIVDNGNGSSANIKTAGGHGLRFTRERMFQYAKLHPEQPIEFSINHMPSGTEVKLVYVNLLA